MQENSINKKKVFLFIVFTYLFSWILLPLAHIASKYKTLWLFYICLYLFFFIPMIVSVVIQKIVYKQPLHSMLSFSFSFNKWFVIGWLTPLAIVLLIILITLLFPNIMFNATISHKKIIMFIGFGLLSGFTVNALLALGQEIGWRGFLIQEFSSLSFFKQVLYIGIIWGVWNIPMTLFGYNFPSYPLIGIFFIIAYAVLFSFLLNYIRLKSKSLIAVAIMHGTMTSFAFLPNVLFMLGNELIVGVHGLCGFLAFIIFGLLIMAYDKYVAKEKLIFQPKI